LPRLDYSGGATCPKLLLEPQRTNLATYSEQFDNAAWTKSNITVTANAAISPDGYTNADLLNITSVSNYIDQAGTIVSGSTYTVSCYVKSAVSSSQTFRLYGNANKSSSAFTATQEWQRFTHTFTADSTAMGTGIGSSALVQLYAYGFQLELGSYATSYIPTLAAAVTRGADSASKTGISSLIGATAGTLYSEFVVNGFANFGTPLCINNGGTAESIWLTTFANGDIRAEVFSTAGGGVQASFTKSGNVVGQTYKIAIGYAANNFAFFVNGLQVGSTDTSGSVPVSMNRVDFDYTIPASFVVSALGINQALLFTTRLTNAQLAELTTI
jgi:hypothetical protein